MKPIEYIVMRDKYGHYQIGAKFRTEKGDIWGVSWVVGEQEHIQTMIDHSIEPQCRRILQRLNGKWGWLWRLPFMRGRLFGD